MSEIKRVLTNLVMAYGLGSKEQFIDAISNYAQAREMNDESVKSLIEQVFDELELTNRRRKAKQTFEAVELERMAKNPFVDVDAESEFKETQNTGSNQTDSKKIISELSALRKAVESLTEVLGNSKENKGA